MVVLLLCHLPPCCVTGAESSVVGLCSPSSPVKEDGKGMYSGVVVRAAGPHKAPGSLPAWHEVHIQEPSAISSIFLSEN